MTFSTTLYATNKADAADKITATTLPASVKSFLAAAVNSLADDPMFSVSASGHLHDGSDTEVSTLTISVTPLRSA